MKRNQGHEMGEAGQNAKGEMRGRKRELLTGVVYLSESSHQLTSRAKRGHVNAGVTAASARDLTKFQVLASAAGSHIELAHWII
jgi:hypothetical protein